MTQPIKTSWYNRKRFLLPSLLILPPLGIYGLWKSNKPIWAKIVFTLFGSATTLLLLIILIASLVDTSTLEAARKKRTDSRALIEKNDTAIATTSIDTAKLKDYQTKWADSIVKDWEGSYIVGRKLTALPDTIYFQLSKGASRDIAKTNDINRLMYQSNYDSLLKSSLGTNYTDIKTAIVFLKDADQLRQNANDALREEKIQRQFSVWDQSHKKLERYIKNQMNDPDSYDHVETRYEDKRKYILVQTTFRGKNSLGVKVIEVVTAKVDLDGEIISIINQ
jgi:hypothetical protein